MPVEVIKVEERTEPLPFYAMTDPVTAFVRATQEVVGATQTGIWDKETHNLLSAWIVVVADLIGREPLGLPTWGVDPNETAAVVASLVPEKLMPIWLAGGDAWPGGGAGRQFSLALGLPYDSSEYAGRVSADADQVAAVMAEVAKYIADVEWEVPRSQLPDGQEQPHVASTTDVWNNPQGAKPPKPPTASSGFPTGLVVVAGVLATAVAGLALMRK